ncbi:prealbumin-like fold domain-containing protein [Agromyces sp. SYSU T0242]|uniref:prealbumin-like fold domain-containing protein n=1 Tax=Agromyces litoreus TaxID=3158561 RepID=UPI0033959BBB
MRTNFARRCLRLAAAAGLAGLVGTAFLAGPAVAAGPLSLPGSEFEIEPNANLVVDAGPPSLDWANVNETRQNDLPTGAGDDSFTQGTKEDTAVPVPEFGSIPNNKSDLKTFGVYREQTGSKDFIHLFWTRVQEPNGTTNMDFEFNQSENDSGNGVTPERTEGDLLIQYDLAKGGTSPVLWVAFWLTDADFNPPYTTETVSKNDCTSANSFPCWGLRTDLTSGGLATGAINTSAILAANSDGLGALSARTFGEASIDFTQLLGTEGCTSFGSAYLKSRSSDSFTAALKDYIAPVPVNITNCASVIIRKQTDPDGATASFGYTKAFTTSPATSNTFSLTDDGVQTFNNVFFGTGLTVDEDTLPSGWKFDSVDCSASTGVSPSISGTMVTFDLDSASDVLDCTYYNETGGTVIVRKVTDPSPDPSDASFGYSTVLETLSGASNPSFSLGDGDSQTYDDVLLGTGYTITEDSLPSGWSFESLDCSASSGVTPVISGATVTFDIDDASDVLDCTYGNQTGGTVIIRKVTDPSPDASDTLFDYSSSFSTLDGTSDPTWQLKDGENATYLNVLFGSGLTVTEGALPSGWEFISLDCSASTDVSYSTLDEVVTFEIDDADDILDCTYTNRASGTIVVEKVTSNGVGAFDFTSNTLDPPAFTLTTSGEGDAGKDADTFSDLTPGTYDVAETLPTGWNLDSSTCDDGSDPSAIGLSAGETVTCTFVNSRQLGSIKIVKDRKHAADGLGVNHPHEGVDFTITGGELPAGGVTVTTDASGVACYTGLVVSDLVNNYTVTETVPGGYVMEVPGSQTANVAEASDPDCADTNLGAIKEFTNIPLTNITVSVDSQVDGGTYSSIECDVAGSDSVAIADEMDDPSITITDLTPRTVVCTIVIDP